MHIHFSLVLLPLLALAEQLPGTFVLTNRGYFATEPIKVGAGTLHLALTYSATGPVLVAIMSSTSATKCQSNQHVPGAIIDDLAAYSGIMKAQVAEGWYCVIFAAELGSADQTVSVTAFWFGLEPNVGRVLVGLGVLGLVGACLVCPCVLAAWWSYRRWIRRKAG